MSRLHSAARYAPVLLAALALLHGMLYALLVPAWQVPDEPSQFEYTALIARLGRVPSQADRDPALDQALTESLLRGHFFEYLLGRTPSPAPRNLAEARALFFMPSQIGGDPPLFYALAALPLRALNGQPIERQLLALRALNVLLTTAAVLCGYAAARELLPESRGYALAAGLLLALQPMAQFVGAGMSNDALANLAGAALCWACIRALRRGPGWRLVLATVALLGLGLATKRTLLPWLLLLAPLGLGLALRRAMRLAWRWRVALAALLLAMLAGAGLVLAGGRDPLAADGWYDPRAGVEAPRVLAAPATAAPALVVGPGRSAIQVLLPPAAEWAQNYDLRFDARVWSGGAPARGRMLIDFGWAQAELPFEATAQARALSVRTFVPLYCPYVIVGLYADAGTLYANQLRAESGRRPGVMLIDNGDLATPSVGNGAPYARLASFLRLRELGWAWRSGRLREPPPLGGLLLGRIFFNSFWGHFGWMTVSLVGGTPWEPALWLVCAAGLLGVLARLVAGREPAWRRHALLLLLAALAIGLLLPLANAYTQTRDQAVQQGRYLFPLLVPAALLLTLGWRVCLPARWRPAGLLLWAGGWAALAYAALALIGQAYY